MSIQRHLEGTQRFDEPVVPATDLRSTRTRARRLAEPKPSPDSGSQDDEAEGLDVKALVRFFLRRRWVMIGVGGVVACLVTMMMMLQPPKFTSAALLLVSPQHQDLAVGDSNNTATAANAPDSGAIESQIEVLESRRMAGRLADRLKLASNPDWNPSLKKGGALSIFKQFAPKSKPHTAKALTNHERESIIDRVAGAVQAHRRGLTYVIEVSATTNDPKLSAKMANELVALYFESQLEMRLEASRSANSWLGERLALLKTEVQQKEAAVEAYRNESGLLTADGASLTEQQITSLQGTVLQARADLAERQARNQQVQSILRAGGSADSIAGVINSETIRTLRAQEADAARRLAELESRYGDLHPSIAKSKVELRGIQAQIRAEVDRIAANLKNEVDVAQARLATLVGNEQGVQAELASNNGRMVKLRELERDANATRGIYEAFLARYQQLSESESLKVTNATLVADATPPTGKSSPKLSLSLIIGLALGMIIGGGVGLAIDLMDEGLDSATAVEKSTGKTVLASIPVVWMADQSGPPLTDLRSVASAFLQSTSLEDLMRARRQAQRFLGMTLRGQKIKSTEAPVEPAEEAPLDKTMRENHPAFYVVDKPMSAYAEGVRSLRTSLLYTNVEQGVKVVAITSAMPGEGKTTTSMSLVRVAALSGQKTIVVDCDMRRCALSEVLDIQPKVGLLQVLRGEVGWKDAVLVDKLTGVNVLPASPSSFTPWDVFGSQAMRTLIEDLARQYDLVVLDCPPVLAVAETRIICRYADETVLVVRWASTPARAANSAIDLIDQCGGHVVGIAINRVDPSAPGRGSYGDVTYQARYAGAYYQS